MPRTERERAASARSETRERTLAHGPWHQGRRAARGLGMAARTLTDGNSVTSSLDLSNLPLKLVQACPSTMPGKAIPCARPHGASVAKDR